jgi:hypothetical protein
VAVGSRRVRQPFFAFLNTPPSKKRTESLYNLKSVQPIDSIRKGRVKPATGTTSTTVVPASGSAGGQAHLHTGEGLYSNMVLFIEPLFDGAHALTAFRPPGRSSHGCDQRRDVKHVVVGISL